MGSNKLREPNLTAFDAQIRAMGFTSYGTMKRGTLNGGREDNIPLFSHPELPDQTFAAAYDTRTNKVQRRKTIIDLNNYLLEARLNAGGKED